MAIANGTCVSFCNQPKTQFDYLRRVTPVCLCLHPFCGWRHLLYQESLRHILASSGYNRSKCYMDQKRIQCWSNALQHIPIYLQPFMSYSEILVGNCNFFLPLNAPIWGVLIGIPWKILVLIKLESWGYQAVKIV